VPEPIHDIVIEKNLIGLHEHFPAGHNRIVLFTRHFVHPNENMDRECHAIPSKHDSS